MKKTLIVMLMAIMLLPFATNAAPIIEDNSHPVAQGVSYAEQGTDQIYNNLFGTLFTSHVESYTLTLKNVDTGRVRSVTNGYEKEQKVTYPSLFAWVEAGTYEVSSSACLFNDYQGNSGCFETKTETVTIE